MQIYLSSPYRRQTWLRGSEIINPTTGYEIKITMSPYVLIKVPVNLVLLPKDRVIHACNPRRSKQVEAWVWG